MAGGVRKQWRAKDSPPFFELAYLRSDVAPFDLNKDICWIGIKGKCPYRGDSLGAAFSAGDPFMRNPLAMGISALEHRCANRASAPTNALPSVSTTVAQAGMLPFGH